MSSRPAILATRAPRPAMMLASGAFGSKMLAYGARPWASCWPL